MKRSFAMKKLCIMTSMILNDGGWFMHKMARFYMKYYAIVFV